MEQFKYLGTAPWMTLGYSIATEYRLFHRLKYVEQER
jgi:hypothetical protein